jgi:hypothetical protein
MEIKQIRIRNLERLIESFGGVDGLIKTADTNGQTISEKYIEQILGGFQGSRDKSPRSIGHKFARKLELGCGKPEGWMDQDHTTYALPAQDEEFLTELRQEVAQYAVPDHIRKTILMLIANSPKKQPDSQGQPSAMSH